MYTIRVSASDQAGNSAAREEKVTIDLKAPDLSPFSAMNGLYYKSFRLPARTSALVRDVSPVEVRTRLDGAFWDETREIKEPGLHVLSVTTRDALGRESEEKISFVTGIGEATTNKDMITAEESAETIRETEEMNANPEERTQDFKIKAASVTADSESAGVGQRSSAIGMGLVTRNPELVAEAEENGRASLFPSVLGAMAAGAFAGTGYYRLQLYKKRNPLARKTP